MIDKAIEEGSKISSQVLTQSGLVGLAFILLLVFCLLLIWLIFSTLLKNVPGLIKLIDDFSKSMEARLKAMEIEQKNTTYEINNLYDATQEMVKEVARLGGSVSENINMQKERSERAKAAFEVIKGNVDEMDKKLEIVIGNKVYKPKKVSS